MTRANHCIEEEKQVEVLAHLFYNNLMVTALFHKLIALLKFPLLLQGIQSTAPRRVPRPPPDYRLFWVRAVSILLLKLCRKEFKIH